MTSTEGADGGEPLLISSSCLPGDLFTDEPLVIQCRLGNSEEIKVMGLLDTGATGHAFIDETTAREVCEKLQISLQRLTRPKPVKGFDGKRGKDITHAIYPTLTVQDHMETVAPLLITKLGQHKMILGKPWMRKHGVIIDMATDQIVFWPGHCTHSGISKPLSEKKITKTTKEPAEPKKAMKILTRMNQNEPGKTRPEPAISTKTTSNKGLSEGLSDSGIKVKPTTEEKPLEMAMIGAAAYRLLSKQKDVELFSISLKDIEYQLNKEDRPPTDPKTVVPPDYHEFLDVFSKAASDTLAPHRPYDHRIILEGGKDHGHSPLRSMSQKELEFVKYLEENLRKGFIEASHAACSSPILLARKPNGGLRFCVDYRRLNQLSKKDRYPIPLIEETLAQLKEAKIFSKIDIRQAFHKLRMAMESEDLTTFNSRFGAYKYKVLPFGLSGGPSTWQHFINDVLFDYLDKFCTAYLDDILIYSKNLKEHREHVLAVLTKLREAGFQADVDKCEFHVTETKYLGLIIGVDGIRMDPAKIKAIQEWETPTCLREVRSFIGFCNFYHRFIRGFSKIAKPLNALTKKERIFEWTPACEKAFRTLQKWIGEAPVLIHFDRNKQCYLETDSSDHVNGGVLSQIGDDGELHPVAFFSKNMSPAECNYEIYDKELLAIIRYFEQWKPELESTELPVKIFTDHRSLEYFMTTKKLTRRQARWAEFLSEFNFVITYRPGKKNEKADALTRRPNDKPHDDDDERQQHQLQTLLPPERLELQPIEEATEPEETTRNDEPDPELPTLDERIKQENLEDELCTRIRNAIKEGNSDDDSLPDIKNCTEKNGLLYKRKGLWVPDKKETILEVIRQIHDQVAVGHPGMARTVNVIGRNYYWPGMNKDIRRYVRNCHVCRRAKAPRDKYNGLLKPLPIPERPWMDITLDYVTGLPKSNGNDAILMVVDRLSKERHYIPCTCDEEGTTSEATAKLLVDNVWRYLGLPSSIVSDRGPQFTSTVWKAWCKILGITAKLSTAYHPETDGQSEIANQEMERHLRSFVNYNQDDWADLLPMAEFAANSAPSATTGLSPFMATKGYEPRMSFDPIELSSESTRERLANGKARAITEDMKKIWDFVKQNMGKAQERQITAADRHRRDVSYEVGDKVWLSTRNIKTERTSKKLDHKMIRPYRVKKLVGSSCQLELPPSMKIHDVFHTSMLRKASDDPLPGQINEPPPPIVVEGSEEWELDDILDSRKRYRKVQYKVKWKGIDEDLTWYDAEGFENAKEVVDDFHQRNPNKPR